MLERVLTRVSQIGRPKLALQREYYRERARARGGSRAGSASCEKFNGYIYRTVEEHVDAYAHNRVGPRGKVLKQNKTL